MTAITSATGTALYYGTSGYYETRKHNPSLDPEPPSSKHYPLYLEDVASSDQVELDSMLSRLAPHLVEKLHGARAALASKQPDYIAQANASMQELFDQVLHHFSDDVAKGKKAIDGRVKKAPWWTPDRSARNGVTRLHRVRFIVQGYAAKVDAETEHGIQDLLNQASALAGIQAEKHRHGSSGEEQDVLARRHLAAVGSFLLYLLRSHRPDLHRTAADSHG